MLGKARSSAGVEWDCEYFWWFQVTNKPDGTYRVTQVKEYVDSRMLTEFFAENQKRMSSSNA
ncbi:hypothetical protein K474DRAFT_1656436 [Panus rudis PR-1116 ss-1]|nr:hypothetical protein K474DRAFT_1656436 [Panus rudis PR-1116 ss-1]